jgi:hypothetical protein
VNALAPFTPTSPLTPPAPSTVEQKLDLKESLGALRRNLNYWLLFVPVHHLLTRLSVVLRLSRLFQCLFHCSPTTPQSTWLFRRPSRHRRGSINPSRPRCSSNSLPLSRQISHFLSGGQSPSHPSCNLLPRFHLGHPSKCVYRDMYSLRSIRSSFVLFITTCA